MKSEAAQKKSPRVQTSILLDRTRFLLGRTSILPDRKRFPEDRVGIFRDRRKAGLLPRKESVTPARISLDQTRFLENHP